VAEKAHAPAFLGLGIPIVAVAEADSERRALAARTLPGARTYHGLEELLEREPSLDFMDIATPPFLHGKQVLSALEHGLHVLCEKPLTLDLKEFDLIKNRSAASGRAVYTIHNWAHSPQWLTIAEIAASGRLGELRHAELHVLRTQPASDAMGGGWRCQARLAGGGVLVDHGWHSLYLLHRLLRSPATGASAALRRPSRDAVEEEATLLLEFRQATALVHLSWRAPERSNTALLIGTRGILDLKDDEIILKSGGAEERFPFPEKLSAGSAHPAWFLGMLEETLRGIADSSPGNLAEAAFCLEAISRAYASQGQPAAPREEVAPA